MSFSLNLLNSCAYTEAKCDNSDMASWNANKIKMMLNENIFMGNVRLFRVDVTMKCDTLQWDHLNALWNFLKITFSGYWSILDRY